MQNELTRLVSGLIKAADKPQARGLIKAGVLELAKLAQVVPDQMFLLRSVANSMTDTVEEVFGPLSMILVLTEPGRRQVYFAVLARLPRILRLRVRDAGHDWRPQMIERLLLDSNEALIEYAFGSCPPGFVRLLTRLGETARVSQVYTKLFDLLTEVPSLGTALVALPKDALKDELFDLLAVLPRTPRAVSLAQSFEHAAAYHRFMSVYCLLTGKATLAAEHADRISAGETPAAVLQSLYHAQPFPPPALKIPGIRYIATGAELVEAAKALENCLGNFVPEAIRGERQYYIWENPSEPAVVFSITADAPFGWCFAECRLARNHRVPIRLKRELKGLIKAAGIRTDGILEDMMRQFPLASDDAGFDEFLEQHLAQIEAA